MAVSLKVQHKLGQILRMHTYLHSFLIEMC